MKTFLLLATAALTLAGQTYTFSDGGARIRINAAPDQIYVAIPAAADRATVLASVGSALDTRVKSVAETGAGGYLLTLAGGASKEGLRRLCPIVVQVGAPSVAPVFYDSAEAATGRRDGARRVFTAKLLVRMNANGDWARLQQATSALSQSESLVKGWRLIEFCDPYTALAAAETLLRLQ